jgi:hypothetical protein
MLFLSHQVFMTQRKTLSCVHEPFGDAFYYGPERLGSRYENDQEGREESGFADTTYADVLRSIDESSEEVRFFPILLVSVEIHPAPS